MSEVGGLSLGAVGQLHSPVSCTADADDSMEPYTTERLSRIPGGYTALTEPFRALDIDFNNVKVGYSPWRQGRVVTWVKGSRINAQWRQPYVESILEQDPLLLPVTLTSIVLNGC